MKNEKTGFFIAERRAAIAVYKALKERINYELQSLKQLYYSMKHSSHFNPKSYENKMLWRQIRNKENEILAVKDLIIKEKLTIQLFIKEKDEFYKILRKTREKQNGTDTK